MLMAGGAWVKVFRRRQHTVQAKAVLSPLPGDGQEGPWLGLRPRPPSPQALPGTGFRQRGPLWL